MNDIYSPPRSELLEPQPEEIQLVLASRWSRLWAISIDLALSLVISLPIYWLSGFGSQFMLGFEFTLTEFSVAVLEGLIIHLILNGYLLHKYGQSIGKKILGIKIVGLDGRILSLPAVVLKRHLAMSLAISIPIVGIYIGFVDNLAILGPNKRCIHDLIAGTKVVEA